MSTIITESYSDSVLELKININEQNAFTLQAFSELDAALAKASSRTDVKALILSSGNPDFYSNGLHPQAIHQGTEKELEQITTHFFSVLKQIYLFPVPVVAAINGHAVGYGAMLAFMSDFRLMVDKAARISLPEMLIGVSLPAFVTLRVTDLVGERTLRNMLFAGFAPKPPEALAAGLVDELVEKDKLDDKVKSLAKKLAALPKNAVRSQKAILRGQYGRRLEEILKQDAKTTIELFGTAEPKEGFAALVEKRRPRFES